MDSGYEGEISAHAIAGAPFATRVELADATLIVDEPVSVGGGAAGPTPYQLLSAALAACTSMTLRLYARGKDSALPEFTVEVAHALVPGVPPRDLFTRRIVFAERLPPDREARLLAIAERCPVHRTLSNGGAQIVTSAAAVPPQQPPLDPPDLPERHFAQMRQVSD